MLVAEQRNERVVRTYGILKKKLKRYGRSVSFPKSADPRKTYSWRYLESFLDRVDSLGLADDCLESLIAAVVAYAHKRHELQRGIAVLDYKNLLEIWQTKLEAEVEDELQQITRIQETHDFLMREAVVKGELRPIYTVLTQRSNRLAYANITRWYKANQLALGYLAVSRVCRKALGTLPDHELALFPAPKDLIRMRLKLTCNKSLLPHLRTILADDIFEE